MRNLFEQLLAWWDAKTAPNLRIHRYEVTPRQGRYAVRRKLLRALHRRVPFPPELPVVRERLNR